MWEGVGAYEYPSTCAFHTDDSFRHVGGREQQKPQIQEPSGCGMNGKEEEELFGKIVGIECPPPTPVKLWPSNDGPSLP